MLFDNLNDKQLEAVTSTEGKIKVVAGAGSGKTRALAYRYAHLVNDLGIDPGNILCLTFTNKAAREMKTRISSMVPAEYVNDFICTIHGFCVKFLREEIHRIGYPKNFKVFDENDMHSLAIEVLTENGIDRKDRTVRDLLIAVHKKKFPPQFYIEELILPASVTLPDEKKKDLANQFILKQKKYFSLDFNDLLYFTAFIMGRFDGCRHLWQNKMQYVMVDEVQDCTETEWGIFSVLSEQYNNLFIVGDPDQSIYEWRGAAPKTFVNFHADKDIIMSENYRSTSVILDAANSVIENNVMRVKKDLFTRKQGGSALVHFHAPEEKIESDWIAKKISELKDEGNKYSDIAILYRASYLSRSIEQALMRAGVNYTIWGGIRFFEREEIKHALCYLRLIASSDDDLAFKRICNVPSRKIGKVAFQKINSIAESDNCSLYEALQKGISIGTFKEPSIVNFVDLIERCRAVEKESSLFDLLDFLLNESGLYSMCRQDGDEDRLENITELLNSVKLYESDNKEDEITLEKYLQDIALYTNTDYSKDSDKVKLMTIHQAKGLEFPYVFITGMSEGIFPNQRSIRESKRRGLEEERRLMYVAVTRAEKALFMTESEGFCPQASGEKIPSRFIREIKNNLYVTEGEMDVTLWDRTDAFVRREDALMELSTESENSFKVNDSVIHSYLGKGVLCSIDGEYGVVKFDVFGERRVKLSILHREDTVTEKVTVLKNTEEEFNAQQVLRSSTNNDVVIIDSQLWQKFLYQMILCNQDRLVRSLMKRRAKPLLDSTVISVGNEVYFTVQDEIQKDSIKKFFLDQLQYKFASFTGKQGIKLIPVLPSEMDAIMANKSDDCQYH